ncbi:Putative FMN-binding split barrel [Septoria linicola]|uniref:FMN-binding split barrel n=1 Tax=Septoria linicola TaxID=215465 RepID=A0A9Q9EMP7_9PEZI|nr:Putative FMN-binding split barrel [Septoria linicola]
MEHDLNITLTFGPLHFKISSSTRAASPAPIPHRETTKSIQHSSKHARSSSIKTAATIASKQLNRLSLHLRSLSGSSYNTSYTSSVTTNSWLRTMTTTANPNSPPTAEAPWKQLFSSHLSKMDSPEFVFSSLTPSTRSEARDGKTPVPYVPRARFCIHRGFWATLPENKHNDADRNDRVYESDLPTFTTDVRMQKPFEIFASSAGKADDEKLTQGSGGGGPCEAVWWVKLPDAGIMMQWRIKGEAYVVASQDIDAEGEEQTSGVKTVKSELGRRMRVVKEDGVDSWSWGKEIRGHFGNISPGMRGSFQNPPPGQSVNKPYDEKKNPIGEKVEDLDHEVARGNFRVVVIKPEEVESVDLSDPKKGRREVYKFNQQDGSWSHETCWP